MADKKFYKVERYNPVDPKIRTSMKGRTLFTVVECRTVARCDSEQDAEAVRDGLMKTRED